ncbi:MAG TPA: hypothetical protein PLP17_16895, partial [Oligoflexia bacterium]|nr:hypothetical protein [Oligoflexia bacterium]
MAAKKTVGRPPKFQEPCRPVTMTLPQRTINKLTEISEDRAQAVVKAVDACVPDNPEHQPLVSLIDIGTNESVIVVGKSTMLGQISGLRLIEISPGRFLLSVPLETPI